MKKRKKKEKAWREITEQKKEFQGILKVLNRFYDAVAETFRVGPAAPNADKATPAAPPGRVRMVIQPKPATTPVAPAPATQPLPLKTAPSINKPREE